MYQVIAHLLCEPVNELLHLLLSLVILLRQCPFLCCFTLPEINLTPVRKPKSSKGTPLFEVRTSK